MRMKENIGQNQRIQETVGDRRTYAVEQEM